MKTKVNEKKKHVYKTFASGCQERVLITSLSGGGEKLWLLIKQLFPTQMMRIQHASQHWDVHTQPVV